MKKTIALVLIVLLVAAIIAPVAVAASTTVRIHTADDLAQLAKNCQLDSYSANVTVVLENDIDMGGAALTPIPTFSGTFDGNGYTISNFTVNADGSHQGFFRYIEKNGTVKNLNLSGTVAPGGSACEIGGIAGTNRGTIESCVYSGSVTGENDVGGIAGENYGTVIGCTANGQLSGIQFTGGIVGYNNGRIESSLNYAAVNTTISQSEVDKYTVDLTSITEGFNAAEETDSVKDTGGIAGASMGELKGCVNYGTVGYQHYGYNVGGIVGRQSGYITGCENRGTVYGRQDVGGIVGQMEPNKQLINSGTLTEELNKLHDLADKALTNGNTQSDQVTEALNAIKNNTRSAINSASSVHSEINSFVDGTIESVNELISRVELVIDRMVPISASFNDAASRLTIGLEKLDVCLSTLEMNEGDLAELDSYIDNLTGSLKRMSYEMDYLAYLGTIYTSDTEYSEYTESELNNIKPSKAEQEEAKQMFGYDYDKDLDDKDDIVDEIMIVLPDLIKDSANANKAKSQIIDKLDEYYLRESVDTDGDGIGDDSRIEFATQNANEARDYFVAASDYFDDATAGFAGLDAELAAMEEIRFQNLSSKYYQATDDLYNNLGAVTDSMGTLNTALDNTSDIATEDLKALNDQANVVLTMMSNVLTGNWDYTYMEDVSEDNETGNTNGKVLSSTNYGSVEGDTSVGGIAGTMGVDEAEEIIEKIEEAADISIVASSTYEARCVIRDCTNNGGITGKKNNIGGIVGEEKIGAVISCEGYGAVESTDGMYVGGIAGYSETAVRSSYAMCSVAGQSYVGGIAGFGTKITDCRTLIGVEAQSECLGTIAGYADVSEEGSISNNLYVNDDLGGIDGISYIGVAERTTYEKLITDPTVPSDFSRLKLSFSVDGEVIKTIDFKYGGTIDKAEIPEVPAKEGFSGAWPEYDYSVLTFSDLIEAVYTPLQASMAAEEVREDDEKSVVLVEGEFEDYANVIINEYTGEGPDVDGEEVLEKWVLRIDGAEPGADLSYTVRYLPPIESEEFAIYILKDNVWTKVQTTDSGSYVVFNGEGEQMVFACVTDSGSIMLWIIIAAAAAFVAGVTIVTVAIVRNSKKKKAEAKAE